MTKKLFWVFVVCGLLGFLSLIPGTFDKAAYIYFRVVDGNSVTLDGSCIKYPSGWVLDSMENRSEHKVVNLRKKTESGYVFASLIDGPKEIIFNSENSVPIKEVPGEFSIYEVQGLPAENTVRYWTTIPGLNVILMGRDVDAIETLATAAWRADC